MVNHRIDKCHRITCPYEHMTLDILTDYLTIATEPFATANSIYREYLSILRVADTIPLNYEGDCRKRTSVEAGLSTSTPDCVVNVAPPRLQSLDTQPLQSTSSAEMAVWGGNYQGISHSRHYYDTLCARGYAYYWNHN